MGKTGGGIGTNQHAIKGVARGVTPGVAAAFDQPTYLDDDDDDLDDDLDDNDDDDNDDDDDDDDDDTGENHDAPYFDDDGNLHAFGTYLTQATIAGVSWLNTTEISKLDFGFALKLQRYGFTGTEATLMLEECWPAQAEIEGWGDATYEEVESALNEIVMDAADWWDDGFTVAEMVTWKNNPTGFMPTAAHAIRWRDAGHSPTHAQAIRARFCFADMDYLDPADATEDEGLAWAAAFADAGTAAAFADAAKIFPGEPWERTYFGSRVAAHIAAAAGHYHRTGRTPEDFAAAHNTAADDTDEGGYLAHMGVPQPD